MSFLDIFVKYATLVTFISAVGSFFFAVIKWLDQRKLDQEQRHQKPFIA